MINNMLNRIKKLDIILFLLIVFPIIIDLINGFIIENYGHLFSIISIALIYRGTIVFIAFFYSCTKKCFIANFIRVLIFLWIISNFFWRDFAPYYKFIHELYIFIIIIFPILLIFLYKYIDFKYKINNLLILKYISTWGFIVGLLLFLSYISGIGFQTYRYGFGVRSFFKAQNDVSLALIISLSIAIYVYIQSSKVKDLIKIIFITIGSILISTRAGLLGMILVYLSFICLTIINKKLLIKHLKYLFIFFVIIISGIIFSYQQIVKHGYLVHKYQSLFIESPRARLEKAGIERIYNREIYFNIIGEGEQSFRYNVSKILNEDIGPRGGRFVEQDIIDIFGFYGLILFLFVFFIPLYTWFLMLKKVLLNLYKLDIDIYNLSLFLCLSLFLGHSFVVGHAIFSALVSTVIAPIYYLIFKETKKCF
jgi:hypothetical protein